MRVLPFLLATTLLGGCAAPPASGSTTPSGGTPPLTAIVTSADLAAGPNHFGLALLNDKNQPVADVPVHLIFFDLSGEQPVAFAEATPTWRRPGSEWNRGQYKADVTFPRAGPYGVQASIIGEGGSPQAARTRFDVKAQSEAPAVGAQAPRSHNLTNADTVPPIELCTASEEICRATRDLRQLTIADAIDQGKPLVVLFATPGFCTSQTCGPQLEVLQAVAERYRGRANFIHVEIFKDPQARTISPTVQEWNLPSEPWTFVVDATGRIADRFDGITAGEEIEQALQQLLS
ncbi:MAG TPA: thioredoxin family protein [Chloroflexota bacterium]|nr:thioredoxin family protein [Chloroflexota bacterium]